MSAARVFRLAWRLLPRVPEPLTRALFTLVAVVAHTVRLPGVRQLEANLSRVRPDLDRGGLRRLSRAGMRSYLRYYGEVFTLRSRSREHITARLRTINAEAAQKHLRRGESVVAALGHTGNWDLAGAWCGMHLARVLTVAEILEPLELFEQFQQFRADLGMDVIGLDKDGSVLPTLMRRARARTYLVPLLADRDLSRSSVEVDAVGHRMRVAVGPAALARALDAPLMQIFIRYERLHGHRRRRAGSPWGVVAEFTEIQVPTDVPEEDRVARMTQAWVDVLMKQIRLYPDQWHMLAKVFTDDLDAERLARSHARQDDDAALLREEDGPA